MEQQIREIQLSRVGFDPLVSYSVLGLNRPIISGGPAVVTCDQMSDARQATQSTDNNDSL